MPLETYLGCALRDGHAKLIGEGKVQRIVYLAVNHSERCSDPEEQARAEHWAELVYRYVYEPGGGVRWQSRGRPGERSASWDAKAVSPSGRLLIATGASPWEDGEYAFLEPRKGRLRRPQADDSIARYAGSGDLETSQSTGLRPWLLTIARYAGSIWNKTQVPSCRRCGR